MRKTPNANAADSAIHVVQLDPTNLTEENKIILAGLFDSAHVNTFFDTQSLHTIVVKDKAGKVTQIYKVSFKYPLVVRRDFYGRIVVDVVGGELGKGSFGSANFILGSVKYRMGQLCYEKDVSWRIMKLGVSNSIQDHDGYKLAARHEFEMTAACPHTNARGIFFGVKKGVFKQDVETAFSMRQFIGTELLDGIASDIDESKPFTVDDRFQLTLRLLEQFDYQVQSRGIIHRDIKPENIIVYKLGGHWMVNFIDFNLSRKQDVDDKKSAGTPCYVAPEYISLGLDQSSDVYSLALVIALIWRDRCQLDLCADEHALYERAAKNWKILFKMFDGITNISDDVKDKITAFLKKPVAYAKSDRPPLRNLIEEFSNIYLTHKLKTVPLQYQTGVWEAHELGYQAKYRMAAAEGAGLNLETVRMLKENLLTDINQLPEDSYAIREFVECTGIHVLANVQSKNMMKDKIEKIINIFTTQYHTTIELQVRLSELYRNIGKKHDLSVSESNTVKLLASEINYAMMLPKKLASKLVNLDEISDQAARLIFRNNKILHAIKQLEAMIPVTDDSISEVDSVMSLLNSMCH